MLHKRSLCLCFQCQSTEHIDIATEVMFRRIEVLEGLCQTLGTFEVFLV